MTFRVRWYQGDQCWGAVYGQTSEEAVDLVRLWATCPQPAEHVVIEQEATDGPE